MSGRKENEKQATQKIKNLLNENPYLKGFYFSMMNSGKTQSYNTHYKYLHCIKTLHDELGKDLVAASYDDLTEFLYYQSFKENGEKKSGNSMIVMYSAVKKYYKYLTASRQITNNPAELIERPAQKPKDQIHRDVLTKEEIKEMFNNIPKNKNYNRNYAILLLALYTGIRCTPLTEIDLEDFDWKAKTVTVIQKRNKKHTYYLSDSVMRAIGRWMYDREKILGEEYHKKGALFVSTKKTRMTPRTMERIVEVLNPTDKHITPHRLRGTFATNMIDAGCNLYEVQQMMGHESPKTTEIYIKPSETLIKQASETADAFLSV